MAKQSITQSTVGVTNIQALPDVVVGDALALKQTFDKTGSDEKTYINNTLIQELNGDNGSKKIGHDSLNITADNVADALEEVLDQAIQAQAGTIVNRSIEAIKVALDTLTEAEMANEMKKDVVGGIVNYNTFSAAQVSNETEHNIIRVAKTSTGTANALAIDTDGTFDRTIDGNTLTIIPNFTNTSSVTITEDGQTAKTIKKFDIGADAYIDLEAEDLKKNTPAQLVWSVSNDFFILRPSGGGGGFGTNAIAYCSNVADTSTTLKTSVVGSGYIICLNNKTATNITSMKLKVDGVVKYGGTLQADTRIPFMQRFESGFELYETSTSNAVVSYILDDTGNKLEKGIYNIYNANTGTANTEILNISGKGWLFSIGNSSANTAFDIVVDGNTIVSDKDFIAQPVMIRFENSLIIRAEITNYATYSYILD